MANAAQPVPLTAQFHAQAPQLYAAYLGLNDIAGLMHLQARARAGNKDALIPRTATQIAEGMQESYRHIGIFDEGRLIAHARISPDKADAVDPSKEAALCAVMVDPDWRGYKLGHALIRLGMKLAEEMGYMNLNTRVHPYNAPMWQTFEKHGFACERLARSHERPAVPDCHVYHYTRRLDTRRPEAG